MTSNPIPNTRLIDRGYFTARPLITGQKIRNIPYGFSTGTQSGPITFYRTLSFCAITVKDTGSHVTIVISVISVKVKLSFNKTKRSGFGGAKLTITRPLRSKKRNFLRDMCSKCNVSIAPALVQRFVKQRTPLLRPRDLVFTENETFSRLFSTDIDHTGISDILHRCFSFVPLLTLRIFII